MIYWFRIQDLIVFAVIIPTYNAELRFAELLYSLQKQTLKPTQIAVIDSESTDQTREIAKKQNCKIITISLTDFDHGTARNLPLPDIKTEFVIYFTQDVLCADGRTIEKLLKPMQCDPNIAVCYGRQIPNPDADPLEMFAREFNYPMYSMLKTKADLPKLGINTFFCSNSCAAYRRSIFEKLGGFENGVGTNEDMLFAAKAIMAGYGVYYAADAKVFHSHNYTLQSLWRRYFNIGLFFVQHSWLSKAAPVGGKGRQMVSRGMRHFWESRQWKYIVLFLIQSIVKALAFKCGQLYGLISCR